MQDRRPVPWVPILRQLLDSSVWETDPTVRVLWVTLILVASEPGRRGFVDMTLRALASRACLSPEETRRALDVLMAPDPHSRRKEEDGRRVVAIDEARSWGWRLVNWNEYEDMRRQALNTVRVQRHRANGNAMSRTVTISNPEGEVEVEGENEKEKPKERTAPPPASLRPRFAPPSVEEVRGYIAEKGLRRIAAEDFVDFYASKGWLVGKAPMKDWRSALRRADRTWGRNGHASPPAVGSRPLDAPALDPAAVEAAARLYEDRNGGRS